MSQFFSCDRSQGSHSVFSEDRVGDCSSFDRFRPDPESVHSTHSSHSPVRTINLPPLQTDDLRLRLIKTLKVRKPTERPSFCIKPGKVSIERASTRKSLLSTRGGPNITDINSPMSSAADLLLSGLKMELLMKKKRLSKMIEASRTPKPDASLGSGDCWEGVQSDPPPVPKDPMIDRKKFGKINVTKPILDSGRSGIVANYNCSEGFGFITVDADTKKMPISGNLFVHHSGLKVPSLNQGERVKFDVAKGMRGNEAVNVTLYKCSVFERLS